MSALRCALGCIILCTTGGLAIFLSVKGEECRTARIPPVFLTIGGFYMVLALTIKACILAAVIGALSGCGMFVKEIDAWGLKMKFPEGYSVGANANTVDHTIERRGLNVEKKAERY